MSFDHQQQIVVEEGNAYDTGDGMFVEEADIIENAQMDAPADQFTPNAAVPPNYNPYHVCKSLETTPPIMSALATQEERDRVRAVVMRGKQFSQNYILTVQFMGGTSSQHNIVRNAVEKMLAPLINLSFEWGVRKGAIRISFDPKNGAWSYIGTDIFGIPENQPTMNLGWLDNDRNYAVIIHEFMHCLGHAHEHSSPARETAWEWDVPAVTKSLTGPPNFWDAATIKNNVLTTLDANLVDYSDFDPESIMLYIFPVDWTKCKCVSSQPNLKLSATDIEWLSAYYPPDGSAPYVPAREGGEGKEEGGTTTTTTTTTTTPTTNTGKMCTVISTICNPPATNGGPIDCMTTNVEIPCDATGNIQQALSEGGTEIATATCRCWTDQEFIGLWFCLGAAVLLAIIILILLMIHITRKHKP